MGEAETLTDKITPKEFERKPLPLAICIFDDSWWNDPEQRNYTLHKCNNPKNTGGKSGEPWQGDLHGEHTYSSWHENEGMKYRCGSNPEKIAKCPMALAKTEPKVKCERFVEEKAHPSKALVLKPELREKYYQTDGVCLSCQKCID